MSSMSFRDDDGGAPPRAGLLGAAISGAGPQCAGMGAEVWGMGAFLCHKLSVFSQKLQSSRCCECVDVCMRRGIARFIMPSQMSAGQPAQALPGTGSRECRSPSALTAGGPQATWPRRHHGAIAFHRSLIVILPQPRLHRHRVFQRLPGVLRWPPAKYHHWVGDGRGER